MVASFRYLQVTTVDFRYFQVTKVDFRYFQATTVGFHYFQVTTVLVQCSTGEGWLPLDSNGHTGCTWVALDGLCELSLLKRSCSSDGHVRFTNRDSMCQSEFDPPIEDRSSNRSSMHQSDSIHQSKFDSPIEVRFTNRSSIHQSMFDAPIGTSAPNECKPQCDKLGLGLLLGRPRIGHRKIPVASMGV